MPRKAKTLSTVRFKFGQPLSHLYSDRAAIDKLRADILATADKLQGQLIALRNTIPTADNSDGRNVVQSLVDRGLYKVNEVQTVIGTIGDRKIKEYKQVRAAKRRIKAKDQEATKKAKLD
jgi:hypothetical protein